MNNVLRVSLITAFAIIIFFIVLISPTSVSALSEVSAASSLPGIGSIDPGSIPFFDNVGELVGSLLNIIYVAAAVFFLVQVAIGGIQWINAGGDPKNLESARGRITNAVIGLVIVVSAFAITLIVTTLLGVNIFSGPIDIVP